MKPSPISPLRGCENDLNALLHHIADITKCREHDELDLATVSALYHLTGAASAALMGISHSNDTMLMQTRAVVAPGSVQTFFDAEPGAEAGSRLAPCPQNLADSIKRRLPVVEAADENGQFRLWLPVWLNERIHCCIRLDYRLRCDAATRQMIEGVVRIYANHQDLLDYSERDSLTSLLNRKTFDAHFARLTARCVALQQSVPPGQAERRHREEVRENWLAVVDIDHFKRINDHFGHLYGDEVLILLANLLKSSFRANEKIFRFGGEEFVILLRSATVEHATSVFERLRRTIEQYDFPQVGRVTISLGFVNISDNTPVVVLGHADQALYYAKQHGRNQIQLYDRLVAQNLLHAEDASGSVEFF